MFILSPGGRVSKRNELERGIKKLISPLPKIKDFDPPSRGGYDCL
jgi:hypothetical protein